MHSVPQHMPNNGQAPENSPHTSASNHQNIQQNLPQNVPQNMPQNISQNMNSSNHTLPTNAPENQHMPSNYCEPNAPEFEDVAITTFMQNLQHYEPTIPDEVTRHFINKGGVDTSDTRILRLFSVVAQKFVADIVVDALKDKQQKMMNAQGHLDPNAKMVLTADDLNSILSEYGSSAKKPPYY